MDDLTLLAECRMHLIITTLHVATAGKRNGEIDDTLRTSLTHKQQEIVNIFHDNSLPWGKQYALPATLVMPTLMQVRTVVQAKRLLEQQLEPGHRDGFAVSMEYDPVPNSRDFGMLPEAIRTGFMQTNDKRQIERFYEGRDFLMRRIYSAACDVYSRVSDYDRKVAEKATRAVLRKGWIETVPKYVAVFEAVNFAHEPRLQQIVDAAQPLRDMTTENVRESKTDRLAVIKASGEVAGLLKHWLGPIEEDDADGGQQAA